MYSIKNCCNSINLDLLNEPRPPEEQRGRKIADGRFMVTLVSFRFVSLHRNRNRERERKKRDVIERRGREKKERFGVGSLMLFRTKERLQGEGTIVC